MKKQEKKIVDIIRKPTAKGTLVHPDDKVYSRKIKHKNVKKTIDIADES